MEENKTEKYLSETTKNTFNANQADSEATISYYKHRGHTPEHHGGNDNHHHNPLIKTFCICSSITTLTNINGAIV